MSSIVRHARVPAVRLAAGLLMVATSVLLAGCRAEVPPPAPARPVLRVATAFAPFSTRLIEEYQRTMPDIDIRAEALPVSGDVLSGIQIGRAHV